MSELLSRLSIDKDWYYEQLRDVYETAVDAGRIDYRLQALALIGKSIGAFEAKKETVAGDRVSISAVQENVNERIKQLIKKDG